MRKLATLALVILAISAPAVAQDSGDMGMFADQAGTQASMVYPGGFAQVHMYLIAFDVGPISGWEAAVTVSDPTWNILNKAILSDGTPLNAGSLGSPTDNYIVGLGACVDQGGAPHSLVDYTIGYFGGPVGTPDFMMCVSGATGGSFGVNGPVGYNSCTDVLSTGDLAVGGGCYPDGCSVISPSGCDPVSTTDTSFGAVKATF